MKSTEEISKLAEKCSETDYSDSESVKAHNEAVDEIRKIINEVKDHELLVPLLKDKKAREGVAFQILESTDKYSSKLIETSIKVLRELSVKNTTESLAAEMLLKELKC